MKRTLGCVVATLLINTFILHASESPALPIPPAVQAAALALPPEARPQEIKIAKNGALYFLLPNGCEIILKEKRNAPVVSIQSWVRTGAIHEGRWMGSGLSHFCEHLLFKGTTKRPTGVLDQEIRGAGGDDNAYTTSERTVYHITTAASGFDVSFDALADMIMDSTFPAEEVTKEHAVVVKEIERYQDNSDSVLWETFERTVYQEHPYRVPVLGYPDRFKRVTREEVFAYYQERYSPQMTTFVAVGDFDAAAVLKKMAVTLAPWKRKSVAPVEVVPEPPQVAPRSVQITHPLCEVPKLMLGFPSCSMRDADLYALDLLAAILGDGRSCRLYRDVKDKQELVIEVGAFNYTPMYQGFFAISATVEGAKLEQAKSAILQQLEQAKTVPPTEEELARAKRKVYTQHIFQQMTADGLAGSIGGDWFVAGDMDFSQHYTERMQKVTAADILRVAKQYLDPQRLNTAIMLPPPEAQEATKPAVAPVADATATEQSLKAQLEKLRADPAVAKAELLAEKAIFELTLKSGVRLVVREDHALPVVHISMASLGGTRWEPAELAGAGNLLAEMLDRGTAKRDKMKIADEAEGMGASLSTFSGKNSFGVNIKGVKADLPKLLVLASESMLQPSFNDQEVQKLKSDVLQQIAQQDESLHVLNSKILRPLLYGQHPYARQNLGTIESVKKVSSDDLKKLHQAWVQPENLAISFVGDVTATEALQLVRQHLGDLKSGNFKAPAVPPVPELTEEKSGVAEKANITGAILTLGFRGTALKNPDRETLDLMAALMSGLGGRLNVALREKQGLAYSVGVQSDSQLDGGAVVFFIQTDAKSLDKALAGMWDEVNKLRNEPVGAKELESVKNYLVGTEAIELQNQSGLAQRLALAQLYEEGAAHVYGRKTRLEKVGVEQLKAAAQKYLDPKRWAKAVLKAK